MDDLCFDLLTDRDRKLAVKLESHVYPMDLPGPGSYTVARCGRAHYGTRRV